jgi:uncharacterized protein YlxW (UPF0749 family)
LAVQNLKQMKNKLIYALLAWTFVLPVVSCGPSAEERQVQEQQMKDSIAEAERLKMQAEIEAEQSRQRELDSIANATKKAVEDSIAAAMAATASKPKTKVSSKPKTETPKTDPAPTPEAPKVGKKKPGAN